MTRRRGLVTRSELDRDDGAELLDRAEADAVQLPTQPAAGSRRLVLRLLRWGEVAQTPQGPETFTRGAFAGADPSRVVLESGATSPTGNGHGGTIVGVAESITETATEALATFVVRDTPAGQELLTLATPGADGTPAVLRDASISFRPLPGGSRLRADGVIERRAVDLRRVAVLQSGAYGSAQVLAVRSAEGVNIVECPICHQVHAAGVTSCTPAPTPAAPAPELVRAAVDAGLAPLSGRLDAVDAAIARMATLGVIPGTPTPPAGWAHGGLFELTDHVRSGHDDGGLLQRALADQITGNNPGIIPPAWLSTVQGIVEHGRPSINAFGGARPLPESGMELDWPYFAGDLSALVAEQTTQKSEVTTVRVDLPKGSAAIKTYAGGSDISYQLLQRSSPAYREQYARIMLAAWGLRTDYVFAAALLAGATGAVGYRAGYGAAIALANPSAAADDIIDTVAAHGLAIGDPVTFLALTGGAGLVTGRTYWVTADSFAAQTFRVAATPGGASIGFTTDITAGSAAKLTDTTGTVMRARLFEASTAVNTATGSPASVILASTDQLLLLAGMSGIVPPTPANNASNASGVAAASTLRINVSGLDVTHEPGLAAGSLLVSNSAAAQWFEDGPKVATAEDVAKLGQNVAYYSFGAPAIFVPAGIVKIS